LADGYCASPFIKAHTYDGLGVLRLTRTGTVRMIQGGNDLLLAIEGAGDRTRPHAPGERENCRWSRALA
jgi:hypothetical protein